MTQVSVHCRYTYASRPCSHRFRHYFLTARNYTTYNVPTQLTAALLRIIFAQYRYVYINVYVRIILCITNSRTDVVTRRKSPTSLLIYYVVHRLKISYWFFFFLIQVYLSIVNGWRPVSAASKPVSDSR